MPLDFASIARLFVRLRRQRKRAAGTSEEETKSPTEGGPTKSHTNTNQQVSSGAAATHPSLVSVSSANGYKVSRHDLFICANGVDLRKLLRATRGSLLEAAIKAGGTCLVEEKWTCTINAPKNKSNGNYTVKIRYSATAVRANVRDHGVPVHLSKATSVPGLMAIKSRRELA